MVSLYIHTQPTEKIAIAVENNQIKEFVIDRPNQPQLVDSIFVGKVSKIEKGLQAAFVDIGSEKLGFLQRKELPAARANPTKKLESLITEGERMIVQVTKDAYDTKGARLTANITIADQAIVYLPFGNYIALSKKLASNHVEEKKATIENIREEKEGAIVRTVAADLTSAELEQIFLHLRNRWALLEKQSKQLKVPSCLYYDAPVLDRFIRKFASEGIDHIYLDDPAIATELRERYNHLKAPITWEKQLEDQLPVTIEQLMKACVHPKVEASNGVSLYIEETEAMTIIDVNSGGFTGRNDKERTYLQANIYAAKEIATQVRLRNLSGIIILDFISMRNQSDKKKVLDVLREALDEDPIRSEVYGFTQLGLVEMTRKRATAPHSKLISDKTEDHLTFSNMTYVYALERVLYGYLNTNVDAIIIDVNPKIYKLWLQHIDLNKIKKQLHQSVYMNQTKGVTSYQVKLAGSSSLIKDFLETNHHAIIDKVL
ncbi:MULTISPECIES: ribonuclease E/G [Paraliobacillus]|uniref:ribonuclease E/G n=1 Tax=Paraliobacillus TaxID=200903 RepID=UPI000DD47594|nr:MULTISPECIES: ribonuclease E/G [Paraliobacillus]